MVTVDIKPGWKEGTKLTFENKGDRINNQTQDIILTIKEKNHPYFKRKGDDLVHELVLSIKESLIGFKFSIKGLDNEPIIIETKCASYPGKVYIVEGRGMPKKNGGFGNFILEIRINFPDKFTDSQREQLKNIL